MVARVFPTEQITQSTSTVAVAMARSNRALYLAERAASNLHSARERHGADSLESMALALEVSNRREVSESAYNEVVKIITNDIFRGKFGSVEVG